MSGSVYQSLLSAAETRGGGYIVLIDPDRKYDNSLEARVESAHNAGADAIFVGGSLMMDGQYHDRIKRIKENSTIPVIFFPGGVNQLNEHFDAILFTAVLSGRNPHYLIGEQVIAAPIVKDLGLEVIPTSYLLFDGGSHSTVEFMSGTRPLPIHRPDIAVAHALASEYLGKQLIYLEAGSGAKESVPNETVKEICGQVSVPVLVGGGITSPEAAREKVEAGAIFIVTGTAVENGESSNLMKAFSDAIHTKE
ncbi:MAG: geranylgeranylglyceryl/heptaprenylglyceryl phosphate synthase [Candidatus Marinimicrobia bacterium]|nr:geranylgeranylglyceryl/heptaprenylglyceryl phosphate synthase [Candidatus Neomarinimicrobiota bacterium]MDP7071351.1 geranylgeranylglyceryl/heptaprenylglyceryl phosphate synthase [Candidatus Neomarinimicrobiota bacterium]